MDGAGGPLRRDLQPFLCPCGGLQSLQDDLLPSQASRISLARPGDPNFGVQDTVEAMPLLGPQVYNPGSASALREMLSDIHPIFFMASFVSVISLSKRQCVFCLFVCLLLLLLAFFF